MTTGRLPHPTGHEGAPFDPHQAAVEWLTEAADNVWADMYLITPETYEKFKVMWDAALLKPGTPDDVAEWYQQLRGLLSLDPNVRTKNRMLNALWEAIDEDSPSGARIRNALATMQLEANASGLETEISIQGNVLNLWALYNLRIGRFCMRHIEFDISDNPEAQAFEADMAVSIAEWLGTAATLDVGAENVEARDMLVADLYRALAAKETGEHTRIKSYLSWLGLWMSQSPEPEQMVREQLLTIQDIANLGDKKD